MMKKTIRVIYKDEIAIVYLDRPEKKNAMSFIMMRELIAVAKEIKNNRTIRVVILTGANNTFCSGIDLADLNNSKNRLKVFWSLFKPGRSLFQQATLVWQDLPIPVIAVIDGHCLGAGLQLALAADFRYAYPDAKFSILEGRWGIVPDMGFSIRTQNIIAQDSLRELVYTARFFNVKEALQFQILTQVSSSALEEALLLANELIQRSPDMIAAAKNIINTMSTKPGRTLRLEKSWQLKLLLGKNQRIAIKKDKDKNIEFMPRKYD